MGTYRPTVTPPVLGIRSYRLRDGISLEVAARRITEAGYPITKSGLGNIETGTRGPSQEFLEAWARAFKVDDTPFTVDRAARAAARAGAA